MIIFIGPVFILVNWNHRHPSGKVSTTISTIIVLIGILTCYGYMISMDKNTKLLNFTQIENGEVTGRISKTRIANENFFVGTNDFVRMEIPENNRLDLKSSISGDQIEMLLRFSRKDRILIEKGFIICCLGEGELSEEFCIKQEDLSAVDRAEIIRCFGRYDLADSFAYIRLPLGVLKQVPVTGFLFESDTPGVTIDIITIVHR